MDCWREQFWLSIEDLMELYCLYLPEARSTPPRSAWSRWPSSTRCRSRWEGVDGSDGSREWSPERILQFRISPALRIRRLCSGCSTAVRNKMEELHCQRSTTPKATKRSWVRIPPSKKLFVLQQIVLGPHKDMDLPLETWKLLKTKRLLVQPRANSISNKVKISFQVRGSFFLVCNTI